MSLRESKGEVALCILAHSGSLGWFWSSVDRPHLIELNRVHHEIRGIDFDTAILSLRPKHYIFAELRAGGIRQVSNLAECADTDFLAVPEERRHELRNIKADRSDARHK
jgi:hypothetical protein